MIRKLLESLLREATKTKTKWFRKKKKPAAPVTPVREILNKDLRNFKTYADAKLMMVSAPFDDVESELLMRGWTKRYHKKAAAPIYVKRQGDRVAMIYLGMAGDDSTKIVSVENWEKGKSQKAVKP